MASLREQILDGVVAMVATALPGKLVTRDQDKAEHLAVDRVVVGDGDPGDAEIDLSPLTYNYAHRIPLSVGAASADPATRFADLDALLRPIGAAVRADRTLAGLVDFLEVEAPETGDQVTDGAEPSRWADLVIVAHYATPDPLN